MANLNLAQRFTVINGTIPTFLPFTPNPISIDISSRKINTKSQTLGGWVFEHYGNAPDVMKVAGYTMSRIPTDELITGILGNISTDRQHYVEWFLFQLQQIYKLDKERMKALIPLANTFFSTLAGGPSSVFTGMTNKKDAITGKRVENITSLSDTYIYYKGIIYYGFFDDFGYKEDANDPSRYSYNFSFTITSSTTDWLIGQILSLPPWMRAISYNLVTTTAGKIRTEWQ
jgi:hypothetical protein